MVLYGLSALKTSDTCGLMWLVFVAEQGEGVCEPGCRYIQQVQQPEDASYQSSIEDK